MGKYLILFLMAVATVFAGPLYLKQSTAVSVAVGPFLDDADGKTLLDTITVTGLTVYIIKSDGTLVEFAPTAAGGGTHDLAVVAATGSDCFYRQELITTDVDTIGELTICWYDADQIYPIKQQYWVLNATAYDALFTTAPGAAGGLQTTNSDYLASGTVATATSTSTITLDTGAVGNADYYTGSMIEFYGGTGTGQSSQIVAYTVGRVCTLSPPLDTALNTDTLYRIGRYTPTGTIIPPASGSDYCDEYIASVGIGNYINQGDVMADPAPTGTSFKLDTEGPADPYAVSTVDDYYNNCVVSIYSGTGAGQSAKISDYVGSTGVVSLGSTLSPVPDATSSYRIYRSRLFTDGLLENQTQSSVIAGASWNALWSSYTTENSFGWLIKRAYDKVMGLRK